MMMWPIINTTIWSVIKLWDIKKGANMTKIKYSEWVKRYCTQDFENPIDALFYGVKKWNPKLYDTLPENSGFREVMDLLFSNGVVEG